MATGSLDANGIWIYGEDDSEATFSGLLNKLGDSTSDAVGTINTDITALEGRALSGLVPINPVSVVVASGSATVTTLGQVTFTGASAVSLNGVFTSAYKNYRVLYHAAPTGGTPLTSLRFRTAGTDYSGATHNSSGVNVTGASVAAVNNTNATNWNICLGTAGTSNNVSLDFFNPAATGQTNIHYASYGLNGGSNNSLQVAGIITATNAFDGFTLTASSNSITGTISVYGYND